MNNDIEQQGNDFVVKGVDMNVLDMDTALRDYFAGMVLQGELASQSEETGERLENDER